MRMPRLLLLAFALLFLLPLALHALWWLTEDHPSSWSAASWSSAELLLPPDLQPQAIVHVYAARVGRWRGIFAHHCWVVVKERGASAYTRFDKVGWGLPVRLNGWAPDGRWYGNPPELVAAIEGPDAEALIPRIRAAVADYPFQAAGSYRAWPGPNSNSFASHLLAAVPELRAALPPTAIGKDWPDGGIALRRTPSRTGVQLLAYGLFGVTLGWVEGVEINLLGLVAGIDVRRPALKLPGFGRIGVPAVG
jgi:hypothetical protein